jgi:hypothetical protein
VSLVTPFYTSRVPQWRRHRSARSASPCGTARGASTSSYYFFVVLVVVVIRHETTAAAPWALLLVVGAFFNDAVAVAIRAGLHLYLPACRWSCPPAGSLAAGPRLRKQVAANAVLSSAKPFDHPPKALFRRSRRKFARTDDTLPLLTYALTTGPVGVFPANAAAGAALPRLVVKKTMTGAIGRFPYDGRRDRPRARRRTSVRFTQPARQFEQPGPFLVCGGFGALIRMRGSARWSRERRSGISFVPIRYAKDIVVDQATVDLMSTTPWRISRPPRSGT